MEHFNSLKDVYSFLRKELPRVYSFDFGDDRLRVFPFCVFESYTLRLFGRILIDNKSLHVSINTVPGTDKLRALIWFDNDKD